MLFILYLTRAGERITRQDLGVPKKIWLVMILGQEMVFGKLSQLTILIKLAGK